MGKIKTFSCPECGCCDYAHKDACGHGYRVCVDCSQEWYTTINYSKYSSPSFYYEVFTSLGRSLPSKDRNGDANYFDKRSVKRRVRLLEKNGFSVTVMLTNKKLKREVVYCSHRHKKIDLIGVCKKPSLFSHGKES